MLCKFGGAHARHAPAWIRVWKVKRMPYTRVLNVLSYSAVKWYSMLLNQTMICDIKVGPKCIKSNICQRLVALQKHWKYTRSVSELVGDYYDYKDNLISVVFRNVHTNTERCARPLLISFFFFKLCIHLFTYPELLRNSRNFKVAEWKPVITIYTFLRVKITPVFSKVDLHISHRPIRLLICIIYLVWPLQILCCLTRYKQRSFYSVTSCANVSALDL